MKENWRDTLASYKNWFGEEGHPVDNYIHWRTKNPKELQARLKVAYDKIIQAGLEKELKEITDVVRTYGVEDAYDTMAGEGL